MAAGLVGSAGLLAAWRSNLTPNDTGLVGRCWHSVRHAARLAHFDQAKLAATLQKQLGIISRYQASSCLMTEEAIRHRLRVDGPWHVVLPGVYVDGRGVLSESQRAVAAFLYAGRGIAVVTGLAAVAWHGVNVNRSEFVDFLVPQRHRRCDAGFARLHRTSLELGALCAIPNGPPVTG